MKAVLIETGHAPPCPGHRFLRAAGGTLGNEARQLDVLSSDYVPHSLLHAAFLLRDQAGWSLPKAIATATLNPARLVGLHDRGEITPGKRAEYVRVRECRGVPVTMETRREGRRIA